MRLFAACDVSFPLRGRLRRTSAHSRISCDEDAVIGGFGEFVNQQGGRQASDLRALLASGRAKAQANVGATKFIDSSVTQNADARVVPTELEDA